MMLSKILYGVVAIVSLLPFKVLYILSDFVYVLLYHVVRYRRKVVRTNLQNAFPDYSDDKLLVIERAYYRHMCDLFVETYKMLSMSEAKMRKHCIFKNPEVITSILKQNKSIIGVMGHYGNWEWLSSFAMWIDSSIDFVPLYKPIHAKAVDYLMYKIRSSFGANPIAKNDILRYIVQKRNSGKLFFAAFVADQTPNRHNLNFWMRFLNQDTPIFLGTERIATKFNLPVISVKVTKPKRGFYEVEFTILTEDPKQLIPGELTRMHTRMLEQQINACPELWLWSHRRWKYKPNDVQHD